MANVLTTKNVAGDFASARLFSQIQESYTKKAEARKGEVTDKYQAKINTINREADQWRKLKSNIGAASTQISKFTGQAKAIVSKLDSLILTINKANQSIKSGDFVSEGYAATFDSLIRGINSAVSGASSPTQVNSLGESEPDFDYKTSIYGATATVSGGYLGTGYVIEEADGSRWKPDPEAKVLRQYDSSGEKTGKVAAFDANGLRLDSLSGSDITFTTAPNTASPESYSGTLTRKGLEVLNSWAYDGLDTEAGRTQALEDLYAAKEAAELEVRRYEASFAMAQFYENRADNNIKGLRDQSNDQLVKQAAAVSKAQADVASEYRATTNSISLALARRKGLAEVLGGFANANKVTSALMNMYA